MGPQGVSSKGLLYLVLLAAAASAFKFGAMPRYHSGLESRMPSMVPNPRQKTTNYDHNQVKGDEKSTEMTGDDNSSDQPGTWTKSQWGSNPYLFGKRNGRIVTDSLESRNENKGIETEEAELLENELSTNTIDRHFELSNKWYVYHVILPQIEKLKDICWNILQS